MVSAEFNNDWYRARIMNINNEMCDIYFIDYGNVDVINKMELKMITNNNKIIFKILVRADANRHDLSVQDAEEILNEIENASDYAPNYYYQRRIAQDNDIRSPYLLRPRDKRTRGRRFDLVCVNKYFIFDFSFKPIKRSWVRSRVFTFFFKMYFF
jgi:hypothetical protein